MKQIRQPEDCHSQGCLYGGLGLLATLSFLLYSISYGVDGLCFREGENALLQTKEASWWQPLQGQAVAEWCVPITCWRILDLPVFKPLVLFHTAFNPSKPVTLFVGRTEDILWLAAVWFFCITYQWEQDRFCHQRLWCFELQGVDRGGLAWLTLSCSFVYFNSHSQEYSELTALPLKLARSFSEPGMEHLVLLFVFTFEVKKKKKRKFFVCI